MLDSVTRVDAATTFAAASRRLSLVARFAVGTLQNVFDAADRDDRDDEKKRNEIHSFPDLEAGDPAAFGAVVLLRREF
jgi:hypothetical protein